MQDDGDAQVPLRQTALEAIRLGWQSSRWQLAGIGGLAVAGGIVPVGGAWSVRELLDAVVRPVPVPAMALPVAALASFAAITLAAEAAEGYLQSVVQRNVRIVVQSRLFAGIHSVPGLATFEDPQRLDRIRLAADSGETAPQEVIAAGLSLAQAAITGAGFAVTLIYFAPWLVLAAVAAAVPTCLLQLRLARLRADVALETSPYHRRVIFYRSMATDVRTAKEVRLFGLGGFLTRRMLTDLRQVNAAEAGVDRAAARMQLWIALLTGLITLAGAAVAAYSASTGRLSVGDVSVVLAAMTALQGIVAIVTDSASTGYRAVLFFGIYLAVLNEAAVTAPTGIAAGPLASGLEFDDVWFRYAEDLPWVLRGVSCRLPAGSAIGIVGLNGAGKTTMIKLLCRMYEPQRGCIRWDGTDIRAIEPASLRRRVSAMFQDFMSYDYSAADNIGLGSLDHLGDDEMISQAARMAGIDGTIRALPRGYQTLLSRIFMPPDDGPSATLSGGEWQRIALARAFLRADADVLILDEPSSGLDADAEQALYQTLSTFRVGRLSVLISHRLGVLASADLILVMEGGRILEQGTHRELISAGGAYARLYSLQAAGYHMNGERSGSVPEGHD